MHGPRRFAGSPRAYVLDHDGQSGRQARCHSDGGQRRTDAARPAAAVVIASDLGSAASDRASSASGRERWHAVRGICPRHAP